MGLYWTTWDHMGPHGTIWDHISIDEMGPNRTECDRFDQMGPNIDKTDSV